MNQQLRGKHIRHGVIGIFMAWAAMSGVVYGQQRNAPGLTAEDHVEIQQLYTRFNFAIDTHAENGMAWARTFTADGLFTAGEYRVSGREKLAEHARLKPNTPGAGAPHHFLTNVLIAPSPEGASGAAYFMHVGTPEAGKPAVIATTGTFQDVLVKTSEGWRFKSRTFHASALPPSMVTPTSSR